ncbi:hypothetical protein K458DRAFT_427120 [Lentithecium fluviatile CBS 122367]|uniref:Uncharacterized protein n=1 Tax=Lentithecium fluviatile CBS 122367 TaxID=1168545 RepID=A0A6G1JJH6_9PLEO|nr:hypothetical protein K458DRAFT_427120 [Lentithecium fluviatile CBS 122367]
MDTSSNTSFYTLLEKERNLYEIGRHIAPSRLKTKNQKWIKLLLETNESLVERSPAQQSVRRRARENLWDISRNVGTEVLLLCFQAHLTQLAKLEPKGLISDLKEWWSLATHPESLTLAASSLREELEQLDGLSTTRAPSTVPQQAFTASGGSSPSHDWSQSLGGHREVIHTELEGNDPPSPFGDVPSLLTHQSSDGEMQAWTMPLTVEGAQVILDAVKSGSGGLRLMLPKENGLPFIVIPYQTCADILRKHHGHPPQAH